MIANVQSRNITTLQTGNITGWECCNVIDITALPGGTFLAGGNEFKDEKCMYGNVRFQDTKCLID